MTARNAAIGPLPLAAVSSISSPTRSFTVRLVDPVMSLEVRVDSSS